MTAQIDINSLDWNSAEDPNEAYECESAYLRNPDEDADTNMDAKQIFRFVDDPESLDAYMMISDNSGWIASTNEEEGRVIFDDIFGHENWVMSLKNFSDEVRDNVG